MMLLAILELGVIAGMAFAFGGVLRSQSRAHARREDLLLNQALHAAGRPWQPAPADHRLSAEDLLDQREELLAPRLFTQTPEQEP